MYEAFGATLTALMGSFTFVCSASGLAADMAKRWQSGNAVLGLGAIVQFPARSFCTFGLVAFWIFGLMRFFRYIGWPKWWVLPYVFLILCPWAWELARRTEVGGDFLALTALQTPVVIGYVRRMRNRQNG